MIDNGATVDDHTFTKLSPGSHDSPSHDCSALPYGGRGRNHGCRMDHHRQRQSLRLHLLMQVLTQCVVADSHDHRIDSPAAISQHRCCAPNWTAPQMMLRRLGRVVQERYQCIVLPEQCGLRNGTSVTARPNDQQALFQLHPHIQCVTPSRLSTLTKVSHRMRISNQNERR
ncbi:hypothetical protein D3C71_1424170 [compost metagenome]